MSDRDLDTARISDFATLFSYHRDYTPAGRVFMQARDGALTYGQLLDITARLVTFFAENKLQRGDRAIIISRDNRAVTTLFMGCLRYGLTAVILNPEGAQEELDNLARAARPAAFFMDEPFFDRLETGKAVSLAIRPGMSFKPPGFLKKFAGKESAQTYPQHIYQYEPAGNPEQEPVPLETVAYILFTSGTTSRPKGVEITHGNLLAQMKTFVKQYGYTAKSRLLNVLPLHHTDGLTQGPVVAFTAGCGVYRPLRFAVDKLPQLTDALYTYRITHFIAVPAMLQLIDSLAEDKENPFKTGDFEFIISTAGYLDPNLWERFEKRFDVLIVNVYGLTETVCEALYCGPDDRTRKVGTVGKPVDTEARVVDDHGNDVPQGQTGEIWLKGPHIMKGYFEQPEATAEVLDKDGWFKTGDLVKIDEDGFYHIVGRKKNLIIVGGINVYPDDVANILRGLPGVMDAAVWGEDDPTWGEQVIAAVLPAPGAAPDPDKLAEAFIGHASVEMVPRRIHVVDEFPRGPAGKVVLRDLQAMVQGGKAAQDPDAADDISSQVIAIAAHAFKCPAESLTLESNTETTRGWNSLAHVEFLLSLEKEFGIKVEPKDILTVRSVGDALALVEKKKAA